ncbi:MAG: hypothetical protein ACR2JW_21000 [Thermomicrobiales bacterium]
MLAYDATVHEWASSGPYRRCAPAIPAGDLRYRSRSKSTETIATTSPEAASATIQPVRVNGDEGDVLYRCRDPLTPHDDSIQSASTVRRADRALG